MVTVLFAHCYWLKVQSIINTFLLPAGFPRSSQRCWQFVFWPHALVSDSLCFSSMSKCSILAEFQCFNLWIYCERICAIAWKDNKSFLNFNRSYIWAKYFQLFVVWDLIIKLIPKLILEKIYSFIWYDFVCVKRKSD